MSEMVTASGAGELLGLDKRTVLRLVRAGKLRSFRTPGGQHRFRREDVERLAAGAGDPPARESQPTAVSAVQNKRDEVEILNLDVQARRAKAELARLQAEDAAAERQVAEKRQAELLAQKRAQAEARSKREREQQLREEAQAAEADERRRHAWEAQTIAGALAKLPRDVPLEVKSAATESLRQALESFDADDSLELIHDVMGDAVNRALAPWRRAQEIEKIIADAERSLPWLARRNTDAEIRFRAAADAAIRALPADATINEVRAALQSEAWKIVDELNRKEAEETERQRHAAEEEADRRRRAALINSPSWFLPNREAACQAIAKALAQLPLGTAENELRNAADRALAPFKRRAEMTAHAETYLRHVATYIEELGAPDGEWDFGDYSARRELADRLAKEIQPLLLKGLLAGEIEDSQEEAEAFIEEAVDSELEEE